MRIATTVAMASVLGLVVLGQLALSQQPEEPAAKAPAAEAAAEPAPPPAKADAEAPKEPAPAAEPKAEPPGAEDLFTQGRDALFRGEYDEAIKLLEKAVAADGTKTGYRLHLARAYRYAGQPNKAAEQLETILKAAPDHVEAGQDLAEVYSRAEKWEDVVRVLKPLLKYRHDYPTYHMLAEAQYHLDQYEDARENYEEAVKLNPKSATDHYQLGNIYLSDNRFALAAESYRTALGLGLDSPVLRYKLGSAYFNLRNYFGPISLRTVPSGVPGELSGQWYLIEPVPGRKDVFRCASENSAVYQIARALADGIEDRPDIHVLRATIYLNAQRYQQAAEMFAEIGPTVPEEDKALFTYYHAQAAFGTGEYDRYLELLKQAIELDPDAYQATLVDAFQRVADQYNQSGDLKKYIEYLAKAVGESPQTASLHLKLGYAYEEARDFDRAMAQWRMVLDLEPDHPERLKLLNLIEKYRTGVALTVPATDEPVTEEPAGEPPAANQPEAGPGEPEQ